MMDAGGGLQNYPDDYAVVNELHRNGELSVRLAYNLFTQKPKQELGMAMISIASTAQGKCWCFPLRTSKTLVPRPDMVPMMESELRRVEIRHLVAEWLAISPTCDIQRDDRASIERL